MLLFGASGRGKSSLALQLIAYGAGLVSDDRTQLTASGGVLEASAPPSIAGLIEARGVGILRMPFIAAARVKLIVDLDQLEDARLPEPLERTLLGVTLPCLRRAEGPHFPAAILHCLQGALPLRT